MRTIVMGEVMDTPGLPRYNRTKLPDCQGLRWFKGKVTLNDELSQRLKEKSFGRTYFLCGSHDGKEEEYIKLDDGDWIVWTAYGWAVLSDDAFKLNFHPSTIEDQPDWLGELATGTWDEVKKNVWRLWAEKKAKCSQ
jgi:hypothetical protein